MKKIEKILKDDLKENKDGINAIVDNYMSSLNVFKATAENDISEANLNIQKVMTNLTNASADDVINEVYKNLCMIDDATDRLNKIDQITGFLFEDVPERTVVKGLKK